MRRIPKLPFCLAILGTVPFILSTVFILLNAFFDYSVEFPYVAISWFEVLTTYGAVILSFLGGIHWGFAMILYNKGDHSLSVRRLLLWSNVVAVLAWSVLLHYDPLVQLLTLILFFIAQWLLDLRIVRKVEHVPNWFGVLRTLITPVVIVCLLLSLFAFL